MMFFKCRRVVREIPIVSITSTLSETLSVVRDVKRNAPNPMIFVSACVVYDPVFALGK